MPPTLNIPPMPAWAANTLTLSEAAGSSAGFYKKKSSEKKNRLYNIPLNQAFSARLRGKEQEGEIGLEIECEGTHLFDSPISYWVTHQDGSLRNTEGHPPIEYVLRKPLPRTEIPSALTYLTKKLKAAGSKIVDSTRTSVHVHLNVQGLTLKQIYQIWCLYSIFEEMLIDFSGDDRKGNLFCLSGKQAEHNVIIMEQAIQSESFNELFNENTRYTSLNMASVGKFGSLEFRSMRGTVDQGLIQIWVDIITMMKDKALAYDNPREIVTDFQTAGPEGFLSKTFQSRPDILTIFRRYGDRHQLMWDGLRMMKDVAYAVKWEKRDESLDKKKGSIVNEASGLQRYSDTLWEAAEGVWIQGPETITGRYHIFNYNYQVIMDIPTISGRSVSVAAREVYILNSDGVYIRRVRDLASHEQPPMGDPIENEEPEEGFFEPSEEDED